MSKCSGLYLELRLSPIRQPLIDLVPDLLIFNEIAGRFDTRVDLAVRLASTIFTLAADLWRWPCNLPHPTI